MIYHPAQDRALAYLRRKGTEATFGNIVERLRQSATAIDDVLSTIGQTAARRRPGAGRWSAQEVADHLAISHRLAFEQWRLALAGQDPGPAVDAHLLSSDVMERSFAAVRHELASVQGEWLELASNMSDEALLKAPKIPTLLLIKSDVEGKERVFEWIEPLDAKAFALAFAVHTREHLAQIHRGLEALATDERQDEGPILRSQRLSLRPARSGDSELLARLFNVPEVRRYLFDDQEIAVSQVEEILDSSQRRFRSQGYGLWLASLLSGPQAAIIGFGGYGFFYQPPELQIYYGLDPHHWGCGLATELAGRLLHYGCEALGFDSVTGATEPPNDASARVMERVGMTRLADRIRDGKPTSYFRFSPG